jgi:hypothetical protein
VPHSSGFTPAQRAYLRKLIRREQERTEKRLSAEIGDAMKGAVHFLFTESSKPRQPEVES